MLRFLATPLVAAVLLTACGGGRGDLQTGSPCHRDADCATGYCVLGAGSEGPVCTVTCAETDDCPRGWACSGVTQDQVLVCARGAPTPFGIGARE